MKSTIISMFIVLIVMITLPMFLFGNGDLAQKFGFGNGADSAEMFESLRAKAPKNIQPAVTDEKVDIYKWVDEHGVTQFSNRPPEKSSESEKIVLSPNTNVISAIKIPEKESKVAASPQVHSLSSPYSPGGMKKMVDEASGMQEKLDQRKLEQDKALQGLFPQN
jgi:hypothetical protein